MRPFISTALKLKEYGHRIRIASLKVRADSRGTRSGSEAREAGEGSAMCCLSPR